MKEIKSKKSIKIIQGMSEEMILRIRMKLVNGSMKDCEETMRKMWIRLTVVETSLWRIELKI